MDNLQPNLGTLRYSVYPRYTAGSPAGVSENLARRVAKEEKESRGRYLTGVYGEENRGMAEKMGLGGIAEAVWEQRGKLYFHDLLTDASGLKQNRHAGG